MASRPLLELVARLYGDDLGQTIVLEQQIQGLDQPCRIISGAGDAEDDGSVVEWTRRWLIEDLQGVHVERMADAARTERISGEGAAAEVMAAVAALVSNPRQHGLRAH